MNTLKKGFVGLGIAALLLGAGLATAQQETAPTSEVLTQRLRGARGLQGGGFQGRGQGDLRLERLSLGTTVELNFYNGDPASGGILQSTLGHVVGEDSEVAFREAVRTAREGATHLNMSVSEQTRTLDLNELRERDERRGGSEGLGRLLGAGLNRLDDGSTVSATFYDGDPEAGGSALQTINFAYGVDSARGFLEEASDLAQDAAFVTVTTSPQERTLDLSSLEAGRFQGRRGGPGQSR